MVVGRSGVGKTEAGLQLIQTYKEQNRDSLFLPCKISSCKTKNALAASLSIAANALNLFLPAFENQPTNNLETIFNQLYEKVNETYPDHVKLFLFDDAEPETSLLQHIDQTICDGLANGREDPKLWKIIVTTQRGRENKRDWLLRCRHITDDCFRSINPFGEKESLTYLAELKTLDEDEKKDLHKKLGGLPLALQVAMRHFKESPVS